MLTFVMSNGDRRFRIMIFMLGLFGGEVVKLFFVSLICLCSFTKSWFVPKFSGFKRNEKFL